MNSLEKLYRQMNRAQRELNSGAVAAAAASTLLQRKDAVQQLAKAIEHVSNVQRFIVEADPQLEYHFDPSRPPTKYMAAIRQLVKAGDDAYQQGDVGRAIGFLEQALRMDPPPFAFDSIDKKVTAYRGTSVSGN
jgi:tetratricopeptide (TPR) repeat protein